MKLGKLSRRWICSVAIAVLGVVLSGCPAESKKTPAPDDQKATQGAGQSTDNKQKQPERGGAETKKPSTTPEVKPGAEQPTTEQPTTEPPTTEPPTTEPPVKEPATEVPSEPQTEPKPFDGGVGTTTEAANQGLTAGPATSLEPTEPVTPIEGTASEPTAPATTPSEPAAAVTQEKPVDLGEPVVDKPEDLKRLDKDKPLWLNAVTKQVVMIGRVCQTNVPLEVFACLKDTKEHEAILSIDEDAFKVHAALIALGAEPGHPVRFTPEFVPATGPEVEITLAWKSKDGKKQTARAQDWIRDVNTQKAMTYPFVFGGSGFWTNEETKETHYLAQGGDFICVSNFPSAMLDLPVESTQKNANLEYQVFTERVPPKGTPVTVILTPKLNAKPKPIEDVKKGETK